jgi:membrane carboxypeptidase/penicillin-binding protein
MMQASRYKQYNKGKGFAAPPGMVRLDIDPASGQLAGPFCAAGISAYFIDGTQPSTQCGPQEIEVSFTANGVVQRAVPAPPPPQKY